MSIPPDALWRGAASSFRQPVTEANELYAQYMMEAVDNSNIRSRFRNGTSLPDVEYRSSDRGIDLSSPVYRFDQRSYESVFQNGFAARNEENTPINIYCNLNRFVHHGGMPTMTQRPDNYLFVSTTLNRRWFPNVRQDRIYRYEIYAPGGIWVAQTLGDRYQFRHQDEVSFINGIAPQYIRSAQAFRLIPDRVGGRGGRGERLEGDILYINTNFNPQSHPQRDIPLTDPLMDYIDRNGQTRPLRFQYVPGRELQRSEPRQAGQRRLLGITPTNDVPVEYYTEGVTHIASYIDSAFRSTYRNEAYIFIKKKYVLVNYAPGSTNDRILNGPHYIGDSFPSLAGTAFAEYGIDASFGSHRSGEAIIFSGNLCARINFAPRSTKDHIIEGIITIRNMFPFFRGTSFEKGIDAAFESVVTGEAYLFKGSDYARINYYKKELIAIRPIAVGFHCFRNSEFERDIGAAFALHATNQAYLFKDNRYVLFHFTPGKNSDYIINGPKEVIPGNWPSLNGVLPCMNRGIDVTKFPHGNPVPAEIGRDEL